MPFPEPSGQVFSDGLLEREDRRGVRARRWLEVTGHRRILMKVAEPAITAKKTAEVWNTPLEPGIFPDLAFSRRFT
jgi:hypothetical protein